MILIVIIDIALVGAAARRIPFEVTPEELWQLYLDQNRRCALTGWPIQFNATYRTKSEKTASLDRIDSSRGYSPDNLQWVHRDVNKTKKNLPDSRFVELCCAVADNVRGVA